MIVNGIVVVLLAVESISDVRTQSISLIRLVIYMALALLANLIIGYQSLASMLGGIIIGVIFLGFAIISKDGIGYGDGGLFICLGTIIGLSANLRLLIYSLMVAFVAGGIYAAVKKKSIKTKIPFIPCILVAYVIMSVGEVML